MLLLGITGHKHRQESPQPASGAWSWLPWSKRHKPSPAADGLQDSSQKKRKLNKRDKAASKPFKGSPAVKKVKHNGSELFDRPAGMRQDSQDNLYHGRNLASRLHTARGKIAPLTHLMLTCIGIMPPGWAVQEKAKRGFLEDFRIGLELATTAVFDAVRWLVRKGLFMPEKQTFTPLGMEKRFQTGVASHEVPRLLPMRHFFLHFPRLPFLQQHLNRLTGILS